METICEIAKLNPENIKDYIDLHNNTWPDLVRAIRKSGIIEEYIYMLDNLVIVIMKCKNFKDSCAKLEADDVFKRWDTEVRKMLMEDKEFFHSKDALVDLKPIWSLDDFNCEGLLNK